MPGVPVRLIVALLTLPAVAYATAGVGPLSSWAPHTRTAAVAVAVTGLALVAAISLAGRLAARSRRLLLAVYGPALRLTVIAVMFLVVGHAVLLSASLFALLSWLPGMSAVIVPLIVPLAVAGFGLMAIVDVVFSRPDPRRPFEILGHPLTRDEAPDLWACVDEVAGRLGVRGPDHVVVTPAWTFAAVEPGAQVGGLSLDGRILVCSLLAVDMLDVREFQAVVAHELGHFHEGHAAFAERYQRVFERGWDVWHELEPPPIDDGVSDAVAQLALLPARWTMEHFVGSFLVAERALAREAELLQDSCAAGATSPGTAAAALAKMEVFAHAQFMAEVGTITDLINGGPLYFRRTFATCATEFLGPDALQREVEPRHVAPLDSHPSLAQRLANLGVGPRDVRAAVATVPPARPASALLGDTSAFAGPLFAAHVRGRIESGAYETVPGLEEAPQLDEDAPAVQPGTHRHPDQREGDRVDR